jgi:hypothetical protein
MRLFENNGAEFSRCRKYRFALWRIWDETLPLVMVIGLNPSTANSEQDDRTISRVCSIARHNGYGGIYMLNCFAFISTDPDELVVHDTGVINDEWIAKAGKLCRDVIFAWGNFKIVRAFGRDKKLAEMFPNALALFINKNGSPKHPLYCRINTIPVPYKPVNE